MTDKRFDTTPKAKKETVVKEHRRGKSIVVSHLRRFKMRDEEGREYDATRVDKVPRFAVHAGRTWDTFVNKINDEPVDMRLDTTWGEYYFFEYQGKWWKTRLEDFVKLKGHTFEIVESKSMDTRPKEAKWRKKKRSELDKYSELISHVWELEGTDYEVRIYKYDGHHQIDLWKGDKWKQIDGSNYASDAKYMAEEFMKKTKDLDKWWDSHD